MDLMQPAGKGCSSCYLYCCVFRQMKKHEQLKSQQVVEYCLISYGRKVYKRAAVHPPRSNKMPTDQDLPLVWPVARSFHPGSVPLPLHQERLVLVATPPSKFANAELMKIPNFLHLTCPLRIQNVNYAMYLLNVFVSESWVRPNVLLSKQ
jgi:hypothetical protein